MTELIEVKTSELEGEALNWAVAQAEGFAVKLVRGGRYGEPDSVWFVEAERYRVRLNYADEWARTGPLLVKHSIAIWPTETNWAAHYRVMGARHYIDTNEWDCDDTGPTALTAACRCIVRLKLGATVLIPVELVAP